MVNNIIEFSNGFIEGFLDFGTTPEVTSVKSVIRSQLGSYLGERARDHIDNMKKVR